MPTVLEIDAGEHRLSSLRFHHSERYLPGLPSNWGCEPDAPKVNSRPIAHASRSMRAFVTADIVPGTLELSARATTLLLLRGNTRARITNWHVVPGTWTSPLALFVKSTLSREDIEAQSLPLTQPAIMPMEEAPDVETVHRRSLGLDSEQFPAVDVRLQVPDPQRKKIVKMDTCLRLRLIFQPPSHTYLSAGSSYARFMQVPQSPKNGAAPYDRSQTRTLGTVRFARSAPESKPDRVRTKTP
ncbi:hypothetical protein M432DRAFT_232796 [Thermoascus aurantiacus ATCC 26904]